MRNAQSFSLHAWGRTRRESWTAASRRLPPAAARSQQPVTRLQRGAFYGAQGASAADSQIMAGTDRLMPPRLDVPPTWAYPVVTRTLRVAADVLSLTLAQMARSKLYVR